MHKNENFFFEKSPPSSLVQNFLVILVVVFWWNGGGGGSFQKNFDIFMHTVLNYLSFEDFLIHFMILIEGRGTKNEPRLEGQATFLERVVQ